MQVTPALGGKYRSLFVIGRGGMGTVEAALEVGVREGEKGAYERIVALKRLLPDSARDTRRLDMFLREARLAAMLDHPNVVRAFDYGEIDGELFLALEYIEGQALARVLNALQERGGELGVSLTAYVLAEVCEGLHAAHELHDENGQALALVHRDVSPQNVMISYDGHVRLLDFGVAKIESENVTKTGEVKGKTAYMSPEQAMGDHVDRRSDLFGVGAVLYECLTLRRMWGDGTDMEVIRKLALESPPRLEDALHDAPAALCALYTRLVARDAKGRPATAAEVANELRALVPQGVDAAARSICTLLDEHFRDQAEEQRRRLTRSLEQVAPDQARELRESILPEAPTNYAPSVKLRLRAASSPPRTAASTSAPPFTAPPSRRARRWPLFAGAALSLAALTWRVTTSSAPHPPPNAFLTTQTPLSPPTRPGREIATVSSSTTSPRPTVPLGTTTLATSTLALSPAPRASARVLAQPILSPARPAPAAAPRPAATAPAEPPPDVDDHPF